MKELKSPVEKFPGTVKLCDPLTFPQLIAWQDAAQKVFNKEELGPPALKWMHWLEGICPCVDEWNIEGVPQHATPETFPSVPREAVQKLIAWLVDEIVQVIQGEETNPNA